MNAFAASPDRVLRDLALRPTASFHEEQIAAYVQGFLREHGIPFTVDLYGDIIAHYHRGSAPYPVATIAHMDHPAFEIAAVDGGAVRGRVLGGVWPEFLPAGTRLRLFTAAGQNTATVVRAYREAERGPAMLDLATDAVVRPRDWGVWDLEDFRDDGGDLLHMRASDDLAGCAIALAALAQLQESGTEADVYGVFTRAEEVGLVGATLVARQALVPKAARIISLESSKVLPGIEQGKGPIVRVGDLRRTFSAEAEALLLAGREMLQHMDPPRPVQRHLMSGGTCEATAFAAYGYLTTGIAVPLGNYHNMAPEGVLAAEYIHRGDLLNATSLLLCAFEAARDAPDVYGRERLEALAEEHRERLRDTALRTQAAR